MTLSISHIQHKRNSALQNCQFAECLFEEFRYLLIILMSVVMLSVFMLNVVMLNVVAPFWMSRQIPLELIYSGACTIKLFGAERYERSLPLVRCPWGMLG